MGREGITRDDLLKAIFAQEDGDERKRKAVEVAEKLRSSKLKAAAKVLEEGIDETLTCTRFPHEHRLKIRSNNGIERMNREIRTRTNVVGIFPDGKSIDSNYLNLILQPSAAAVKRANDIALHLPYLEVKRRSAER